MAVDNRSPLPQFATTAKNWSSDQATHEVQRVQTVAQRVRDDIQNRFGWLPSPGEWPSRCPVGPLERTAGQRE